MFDSKHYMPILRWKTAEKEALNLLDPKDKAHVTPLVELIMPPRQRLKKGEAPKTPEEYKAIAVEKLKEILPAFPKEVKKYWDIDPLFIDLSLLVNGTLKQWGYKEIAKNAKVEGVTIIPVVRLNDNSDVENVVVELAKQDKTGLCLRILRTDLENEKLASDVKTFLEKHALKHDQVHILVDLELVENTTTAEYTKFAKALKDIPDLLAWRTFTVAGGAFPFDLSHLNAHDMYRIPRSDWTLWLSKIHSGDIERKPAFADYTIQHPVYTEPNPNANPSASVRYAAETEWIIMRGEALYKIDKKTGKEGPGHTQYPSHAQLLMNQKEYKGKDHCAGDAYIAEKGVDVDTPKPGNPRTWLRAGVNHHLVLTARQVSSLP